MHDNEFVATETLVRTLLYEQLQKWAGLSLTPIPATGTDNIIFRLGRAMTVRMPRIESATRQIERDHRWLPVLAPQLPCAVATPLAVGVPGCGYPFPWAVHAWLDGKNPAPGDHPLLAQDLASFVNALSNITDGPPSSRSGPLSARGDDVMTALDTLTQEIDVRAAEELWTRALAAPEHRGRPVWQHADLTVGNILIDRQRLSAVIDFGPSGLGDPAVDLVPAWRVFRGDSRLRFQESVQADEHAWLRAEGWALSIAVLELAYYRHRDRALADAAREALRELGMGL